MTDTVTDKASDDPFERAQLRVLDKLFDKKTGSLTEEGEVLIMEAVLLLQEVSWQNSENKGFHESGRGFPEEIALIHSEVSEALESDRSGEPALWYAYSDGTRGMQAHDTDGYIGKPEGAAAELADVLVRIGDSSRGRDMPVAEALIRKMRYNSTRPYKHGRNY